jgi:hypothetical protein
MSQNLHLIEVKYLGPSNTRGSKVKLTSLRFPGDSLTVSYSYRFHNILDEGLDILKAGGFKVVGYGYDEKKKVYIIASSTFEPIKTLKNIAKTLQEGKKVGPSDWKYFNKSEKWERSYLPKRKTTAKRYK